MMPLRENFHQNIPNSDMYLDSFLLKYLTRNSIANGISVFLS